MTTPSFNEIAANLASITSEGILPGIISSATGTTGIGFVDCGLDREGTGAEGLYNA